MWFQDQESQSCELGYILGKKFWGGFMTEAVIAVLDFLLNKVGFKEIKATYVSLNRFRKSWKNRNAVCRNHP